MDALEEGELSQEVGSMYADRSTTVPTPTRLIRPVAASLVALAAGALTASPAAATFGVPFDLSEPGRDAGAPQVAVAADGDAVFAWRRFDGANFRIQARARSAAGVLSPVVTLSSSGRNAFDPQVAVDADGDAVVTWWRSDGTNFRVQARARSATGVLSATQTLSDPGQNALTPDVAVDADGDAVFTWARFDGMNWRIQGRARSAAGALSAVQDLSDAGQNAFDVGCVCPRPQVALDPGGDAVFAWSRSDGAIFRAQTRERSAAGALSAVQTLSQAGQHALGPQIAVDVEGDAVFAWERSDGADDRAQTRARSAAGVLSAVQTLSSSGADGNDPEVAVDADGDAAFTWWRFDGANERIQGRARSAGGVLSGVQNLSPAGQSSFDPQVAMDAGGNAVFTWRRTDHIDAVLGHIYAVQARERNAAGTLFAVQTLSDSEQSALSPQVAVDPEGDATVVWEHSNGTNVLIQAALGP